MAAVEILDVDKAKPPTRVEICLQWCLYIAYFLLIILPVLPAISILLFFYVGEKNIERRESNTRKLHHYNLNLPVPLLSLSEIIRSTELNINPYLEPEKTSTHGLKEPADNFVTILPFSLPRESDIVLHELGSSNHVIRSIQPPFLTDFASIPLGPKTGAYTRAAIVHDWLYSYYPLRTISGRRICDLEMLNIMRSDKCPPLKRALIYSGLRLFGGMAFLQAPSKRKENNKFVDSKEFRNCHKKLMEYLASYTSGFLSV